MFQPRTEEEIVVPREDAVLASELCREVGRIFKQ